MDYLKMTNQSEMQTGVEEQNDAHVVAYMIVEKAQMKKYRDALKPHRGQLITSTS
jgi:hypothetical protein